MDKTFSFTQVIIYDILIAEMVKKKIKSLRCLASTFYLRKKKKNCYMVCCNKQKEKIFRMIIQN